MKRPLSAIELDVLAGAAHGETVAATARRLCRAPATVKNHRKAIIATLSVRNMAHAVDVAHRAGLLGERPTVEPITTGQVRAFNGKLGALARSSDKHQHDLKRDALDEVAQRFGREFTSTLDMSSLEANWILDLLDERLATANAVEVKEAAVV
jgi:DNA-binding CsgD family transcriptional regulator